MIKKLAACVGKYKKFAIATPFIMLGEAVMDIVLPLIMANMIDYGIQMKDMGYTLKMGGLMILCTIISLICGAGGGITAAHAATGFAKNLRAKLFKKVQTFSFSNIDRFSTASLVTRLTTDVTNTQNAFQMLIRMAVRSPVMLIGAAVNYFAVSEAFIGSGISRFMEANFNLPAAWWNVTPFYEGMPASAKLSAIGFMFFGCGVEMAGITVSRGIVKWFKGKEMALAMGVEMAIARLGVAVVFLGVPVVAAIKPISVSRPMAVAVVLLMIGLISFICYAFMDKKLEMQLGMNDEEKDDPFKISDLGKIFSSKVFWQVALLCVLYYSAIFPFQKYAGNMLQCNLGYTALQAGQVFFVFPLGAAVTSNTGTDAIAIIYLRGDED